MFRCYLKRALNYVWIMLCSKIKIKVSQLVIIRSRVLIRGGHVRRKATRQNFQQMLGPSIKTFVILALSSCIEVLECGNKTLQMAIMPPINVFNTLVRRRYVSKMFLNILSMTSLPYQISLNSCISLHFSHTFSSVSLS